MTKELTSRQNTVLDLRHGARWTFRQIASHLGVSATTVHEYYNAAMKKQARELKDIPELNHLEWMRVRESEFADARMRDYLDVYQKAISKGKLHIAVEALNGCHRYMETMIKMKGISAPEKREVTLTVDMLQAELARIEAEIGPIVEGEIVEQRRLKAR